jgi:hypothetical protein
MISDQKLVTKSCSTSWRPPGHHKNIWCFSGQLCQNANRRKNSRMRRRFYPGKKNRRLLPDVAMWLLLMVTLINGIQCAKFSGKTRVELLLNVDLTRFCKHSNFIVSFHSRIWEKVQFYFHFGHFIMYYASCTRLFMCVGAATFPYVVIFQGEFQLKCGKK